jgi:hypothetical protein
VSEETFKSQVDDLSTKLEKVDLSADERALLAAIFLAAANEGDVEGFGSSTLWDLMKSKVREQVLMNDARIIASTPCPK